VKSPERMASASTPSELGRLYRPVLDEMVLAALDRAQRHDPHGYDAGVRQERIAGHLGFEHTPATSQKLGPQIVRLKDEGLVVCRTVHGSGAWKLTPAGISQLAIARRSREIRLPESPQHRLWRHARMLAGEHTEAARDALRLTLGEAIALIDSDNDGESDAWFALGARLALEMQRVGTVMHCLREWREPDEQSADVDAPSLPESRHRRNIQRMIASTR
jgi:DNA-binding PadR family transcriptional regulator